MQMPAADQDVLLACLAEAQGIGAIGPGPLGPHLFHALSYVIDDPGPATCADLGSGGGLPALPLALAWPATTWVLIEAWTRRARMLHSFVGRLGLRDRVRVLSERAELVGRSELRGVVDLVVARSFGRPAVTLECAAPLLATGASVVISSRQDDPPWPASSLEALGLGPMVVREEPVGQFRSATKLHDTDGRYPRRVGVPERRPLF